jgi:hypothetical protein
LPLRLNSNHHDPSLTAELASHLVTFPLPAPSARRGEFDTIGTELWNISTRLFRRGDENASASSMDKRILCLLRVFSCLLLDSAQEHGVMDKSSTWTNGIRILKVLLKAAKSCAKYDETDWGTKTPEKAADYVIELAMVEETSVSPEDRAILERLRNEFLVMRVMLVKPL